nr:MAG TPA: hypothetical protein [Caudoviricetes sp.]
MHRSPALPPAGERIFSFLNYLFERNAEKKFLASRVDSQKI